MTRLSRGWFFVVASLALGVAVTAGFNTGCDGGGDGTGGDDGGCLTAKGCFDYACYKAGPTRSFRTDVMPIFEQSCGLSSACHGDGTSPTDIDGYRPYLGEVDPEITPSNVPKILGLIVGKDSPAAPSEKIVDPGKPEVSFLMQKMDGDVDCGAVECEFDTCGDSMPQGVKPLPQETRDVIRDWIKQGALDN